MSVVLAHALMPGQVCVSIEHESMSRNSYICILYDFHYHVYFYVFRSAIHTPRRALKHTIFSAFLTWFTEM